MITDECVHSTQNIHTQTYTYIYIYTHIHIHTLIYIYVNLMYLHTFKCMQTCDRTYYKFAYVLHPHNTTQYRIICIHMCACVLHISMFMTICNTYIHTYIHKCRTTYVKYIHTYIHYIHTCTHT